MLTIVPLPTSLGPWRPEKVRDSCALMTLSTARLQIKVPFRLISIALSISSREDSEIGNALCEPTYSRNKHLIRSSELGWRVQTYTSTVHEMINSSLAFQSDLDHVLYAIDVGNFDVDRNGRVIWISGVCFARLCRLPSASFVAVCEDDSESTRFSKRKSGIFSYSACSLER